MIAAASLATAIPRFASSATTTVVALSPAWGGGCCIRGILPTELPGPKQDLARGCQADEQPPRSGTLPVPAGAPRGERKGGRDEALDADRTVRLCVREQQQQQQQQWWELRPGLDHRNGRRTAAEREGRGLRPGEQLGEPRGHRPGEHLRVAERHHLARTDDRAVRLGGRLRSSEHLESSGDRRLRVLRPRGTTPDQRRTVLVR